MQALKKPEAVGGTLGVEHVLTLWDQGLMLPNRVAAYPISRNWPMQKLDKIFYKLD
jgi:hypothetical protein